MRARNSGTAAPGTGPAERRRFPRVRLSSPLHGRLASGRGPFQIWEVSGGGFSLETPEPFVVGTHYTFRIEIPSGPSSTVLVICRRCTLVDGPGGRPSYKSGFEFLPQPSQNLRLVLGAIAAEAP